MCNATIPTPPACMPTPQIDRMAAMQSGHQMAAMHNATIPTSPACMPSPQSDRMAAMQNAAIPIPPVASAASPPQPPLLNNLERMKIAVILIPPSAATAPNTDRLEQMRNATIPQALLVRTEMMDEQLQPPALTGGNVDHPHQSTSIEVADGQTQPSAITGDAPTPDEHQALEQAGLATSDADDDSDIQYLISSWVQNVQAVQYTVDMINLLEVSCHPHVGYSLQPYTRGPPYPSQQSAIEMAIVYLGCCIECVVIHLLGMPQPSNWLTGWYANLCLDMMINEISLFIPNWMPRSPNKYAGFVFPWWVDGSLQYTADFEQMRGARIFPIAHKYFQHTWPLQQLSMGDWIDEWMEEKVSAYMITVRGVVHELEKNEQDIDHLFSQWFALSRLLGLQDA
ncbi:hypothetical protein F5141DRAFT_1065842 [Pisolithus sp. B1]|nr:hypothetical protein F5141DRAFT_1065842 [Pisolithus sp. B1]